MRGAELVLRTASAAGVGACFVNPGTTELPLVAALPSISELRTVLCLFEGVASGAADGWARMTRRPAMTLSHLGPGYANGLANLHNARRANSPVLAMVGDHPLSHRRNDPPLAADIEGLAAPLSRWVRRTGEARSLGADVVAAVEACMGPPGGVATLIVPADCQWATVSDDVPLATPPAPKPPNARRIERVGQALRSGGSTALLLGGEALLSRGLYAADRVARAAGCTLLAETFPARLDHGGGAPAIERVPYMAERARMLFRSFSRVILVGAKPPVPYFADEGDDEPILSITTDLLPLAEPGDDVVSALEALASIAGAAASVVGSSVAPSHGPLTVPRGPLDARSLMLAIACAQPEGAIVVDEGVSLAGAYLQAAAGFAPPFSYLALTGGATGFGLPCAIGAALGAPGRTVIAIEGDGSALYTPQALWTMAREGLDVVVILCNNGGYRILQHEIARLGELDDDGASSALTQIARPAVDWPSLCRGFGIEATRVADAEHLAPAIRAAVAARGPHVIEVILK